MNYEIFSIHRDKRCFCLFGKNISKQAVSQLPPLQLSLKIENSVTETNPRNKILIDFLSCSLNVFICI